MTPRSCLRWKPTGKISKTVGLRWVPTGKIFNSSTIKVDSEPPNGSNADITNQYECEQTLGSLGMLGDECVKGIMPTKIELTLEQSQQGVSNDVLRRPGIENKQVRYNIYTVKRSSRNQRYKRQCCSLILAESVSLPHAHAQTTNTYYKHQDSRIKKAQVLKTKTSANSDIKDLSSETKFQGIFFASFQDDAKYEHVGTKTQDHKVEKMIKTEG
nr:hypothetical protein [Tanacetum cinerariifolium]